MQSRLNGKDKRDIWSAQFTLQNYLLHFKMETNTNNKKLKYKRWHKRRRFKQILPGNF